MKGVVLVVLFVGLVCALPRPQKRSLDCSGFPEELSGRLVVVTHDESTSTPIDMNFNMDLKLQRLQAELSVQEHESNIILDYEAGKTYVIYSGGCYVTSLTDELPFPTDFDEATQLAKGSQGLGGPTVEFYEFTKDNVQGVFTLQSGGQCIPISFAAIEAHGSSVGSYFDLKTTADPEKLKIPEECEHQNSRRFISAVMHAGNLNNKLTKVLKRSMPLQLLPSQVDTQKRGLPWVLPGLASTNP